MSDTEKTHEDLHSVTSDLPQENAEQLIRRMQLIRRNHDAIAACGHFQHVTSKKHSRMFQHIIAILQGTYQNDKTFIDFEGARRSSENTQGHS